MGNIIKFIFIKIIKYSDSFINRIKLWSYQFDKNIILGAGVSIKYDTILQIKYGGNIEIGDNTEILEGVKIITYGGKISIGERCSINHNTIIYGHGNTIIGNDVLIAGGCMIIPAEHCIERTDIPINKQGIIKKPIIIEDDVWIGHGCSILGGIRISKGSVIGAGSVVTKDIPPYSIAYGVPAKVIRSRI